MTAIVFFDVDGVVNVYGVEHEGDVYDPATHFDPELCARFVDWATAHSARIVLTSQWREYFPREQVARWVNAAARAGGSRHEIEINDHTMLGYQRLSDNCGGSRGEEIAHWIRMHAKDGDRPVVVDDKPVGCCHWIHASCNRYQGFTATVAAEADMILSRKQPWPSGVPSLVEMYRDPQAPDSLADRQKNSPFTRTK